MDGLTSKLETAIADVQEMIKNAPKIKEFKKDLESLINKHSLENVSNTPDFLLADYLVTCLINFNEITKQRSKWYDYNESASVCGQPGEKPKIEQVVPFGLSKIIHGAIIRHLSSIYMDVKLVDVQYISPLNLRVRFSYTYCVKCGRKDMADHCGCQVDYARMEDTVQLNEEFLWTI